MRSRPMISALRSHITLMTLKPTMPEDQTQAIAMLIRMALTSEEALMTPALIAMLESLPIEAGKQVAKIMIMLASKAVPDDGAWRELLSEFLTDRTDR
jgi:hypothetical protein